MSRRGCNLLALFFASVALLAIDTNAAPGDLRGPIELLDQSPHALLHTSLSPQSGWVLEDQQISTRASLAWSNTFAVKDAYILDAESASLNLEVKAGIGSGLEIGAALPIIYRGGGSLDRLIDDWHDFFSLPQGDRDLVSDNQYDIAFDYDNGESSSLEPDGTELGDIELRAKFVWLEEENHAFSLGGALRLPTASEASFGQDSVDLLFSMLGSFHLGSGWGAHAGVGYSWFGDTDSTLRFEQNHLSAFLIGEYQLATSLSILVGVLYESALLKPIDGFPDYALYLDTGAKYALSEVTNLEFLVRENPGGKRGTADVSFIFGIEQLW